MPTQLKRVNCGRTPAPAPDLQAEQLQLVFGQLSEAKDFIRCSAVSKAWEQAVKLTKPTRLEIAHCGGKKEARAQLRWLQGMQKADCFKDLQIAELGDYDDNPDPSQGQSSILSQGFAMLTGAWHLHTAKLYGPFCFSDAIALLPTSLSTLEMWPETGPITVCLSDFRRFTNLKALRLAIGTDSVHDKNDIYFVIDVCFAGLELLIVYDRLCCTVGSELGEVAALLPCVQYLGLKIKADPAGQLLASCVLAMLGLRKLKLTLLDGQGSHMFLTVPKASQLEELVLLGPSTKPKTHLKLKKMGIEYDCQSCRVSSSNAPSNRKYEDSFR